MYHELEQDFWSIRILYSLWCS